MHALTTTRRSGRNLASGTRPLEPPPQLLRLFIVDASSLKYNRPNSRVNWILVSDADVTIYKFRKSFISPKLVIVHFFFFSLQLVSFIFYRVKWWKKKFLFFKTMFILQRITFDAKKTEKNWCNFSLRGDFLTKFLLYIIPATARLSSLRQTNIFLQLNIQFTNAPVSVQSLKEKDFFKIKYARWSGSSAWNNNDKSRNTTYIASAACSNCKIFHTERRNAFSALLKREPQRKVKRQACSWPI